MKDKIYLEDLVPYLNNVIIKLDTKFIKNLLIDSSCSNKPYKSKEFCLKIGTNWNTRFKFSSRVYAWFSGKRNIRVKDLSNIIKNSHYTWHDVEKNIIFIKAGTKKGEIKFDFPINLDKNFGSVIGYLLGDGSIDKKMTQPFFTNQNKELLSDFQSKIFHIFNVNPRIWYQKPNDFKGNKSKWVKRVNSITQIPHEMQGGLFYYKIVGQILIAIFGKFSFGRHKEVTEQIFYSNNQFKMGFLQAFYDSEGSFSSSSSCIRGFQDRRQVLEKISLMLLDFNIIPNNISYYIKKDKKRYYIDITGFYNILNFKNNIGIISSKKSSNLSKVIFHLKNHPRLRHDQTRNIILEILKSNNYLTINDVSFILREMYPRFLWDRSTINYHLSLLKT